MDLSTPEFMKYGKDKIDRGLSQIDTPESSFAGKSQYGSQQVIHVMDPLPPVKTKSEGAAVRLAANWGGKVPTHLQINHTDWNPAKFKIEWVAHSSKFKALVDQIRAQDDRDMQEFKTTFKHVIYTDIQTPTYGTELIASVLMAEGFRLAKYKADKDLKRVKVIIPTNPEKTQANKNAFMVLSSNDLGPEFFSNMNAASLATVKSAANSANWKEQISEHALKVFNYRTPAQLDNSHGALVRFLVIDSGFKEGISLFDVRHMWLTEPPRDTASLNQALGRGARFCGSKQLPFSLWKLYVHVLYSYVEVWDRKTKSKMRQNLYGMQLTDDFVAKAEFDSALEKMAIDNSIDRHLNQAVNTYNQEGWIDPEKELAKFLCMPGSKISAAAKQKCVNERVAMKQLSRK
jgi:hypothetical protein